MTIAEKLRNEGKLEGKLVKIVANFNKLFSFFPFKNIKRKSRRFSP
ncbi:hypothetical protein [Petrotoga mobilis]|nr:hypothetical protein [Petrotoga mobilis]